jgi:hypothetical protein
MTCSSFVSQLVSTWIFSLDCHLQISGSSQMPASAATALKDPEPPTDDPPHCSSRKLWILRQHCLTRTLGFFATAELQQSRRHVIETRNDHFECFFHQCTHVAREKPSADILKARSQQYPPFLSQRTMRCDKSEQIEFLATMSQAFTPAL